MTTLSQGNYVLWCMWNAPHTIEADVVADEGGVALQLFVNDRLTTTARFPTLSRAVQCAEGLRDLCQSLGWHLCATADLGCADDDQDEAATGGVV